MFDTLDDLLEELRVKEPSLYLRFLKQLCESQKALDNLVESWESCSPFSNSEETYKAIQKCAEDLKELL